MNTPVNIDEIQTSIEVLTRLISGGYLNEIEAVRIMETIQFLVHFIKEATNETIDC